MLKERLPTPNALIHYIKHNTCLWSDFIMVRKLNCKPYEYKENEAWNRVERQWTIHIQPGYAEELVPLLFELSLSSSIADYICGSCNQHPYRKFNDPMWVDVINLVDSKDGNTNIVPELVDTIRDRYDCWTSKPTMCFGGDYD